MGKTEKPEHVPLFAHFLRPRVFALFLAGGLIFSAVLIHNALISDSRLDLFNAIIVLIAFFPISIFLRTEANKILVRGSDDTFSEKNNKLRNLFENRADCSRFLNSSRKMIFNRKEYFLIVSLTLSLIATNPSFQDLTVRGKATEILQKTSVLELVKTSYTFVYWVLIVGPVLLSMVWAILGITAATFMLGREKDKLRISRTIAELKRKLSAAGKNKADRLDFSPVELSFSKLKEGLIPVLKLIHKLSLVIASFGLLYSVPAIVYFFATHDISPYIYYGFCIFVAVLSCAVLAFGELATRGIWKSSKDDAVLMLEELCDKVKLECMKSLVRSEDFDSRENLQKDVTFLRTAIDDLKNLKTSELTFSTTAKILTTIILPYIPLVTKLLGFY